MKSLLEISGLKKLRFSGRIVTVLAAFLLAAVCLTIFLQPAAADDPMVTIGDITRTEGARSNQLVGYGLVTGLGRSGDSTRSQATVQSIANMLGEYGVEISPDQVEGQNIAAVMVTADLPHDASTGDTIDVQVSAIGDADSLAGGMLVRTPLEAPTGEVYAVAQGSVSLGGEEGEHPTSARVPGGGIIERTVDYQLDRDVLDLALHNGNFRTASEIVDEINDHFADLPGVDEIAQAEHESKVRVEIPPEYSNDVVGFIAEVNDLEVQPTMTARVVINENNGTIVKGHNARISTVSVAHENMSVTVSSDSTIQQGEEEEAFIEEEQEMEIEDEQENSMVVEGGSNTGDLITALNAVGADASDMVSILQEIEAAGALHAELEVR